MTHEEMNLLIDSLLDLCIADDCSLVGEACCNLGFAIYNKLPIIVEGADGYPLRALKYVAEKYNCGLQIEFTDRDLDIASPGIQLRPASNPNLVELLIPRLRKRDRDFYRLIPAIIEAHWTIIHSQTPNQKLVEVDSFFVLALLGSALEGWVNEQLRLVPRGMLMAAEGEILSSSSLSLDNEYNYRFLNDVAETLSDAALLYLGLWFGDSLPNALSRHTTVVNHPFNSTPIQSLERHDRWDVWKNGKKLERNYKTGRVWFVQQRKWRVNELGNVFQVLNELKFHRFRTENDDFVRIVRDFQKVVESKDVIVGNARDFDQPKVASYAEWKVAYLSSNGRKQKNLLGDWRKACQSFDLNAESLLRHFAKDSWPEENDKFSIQGSDVVGVVEFRPDYTWIQLPGGKEITLTVQQGQVIKKLHSLQSTNNNPVFESEVVPKYSSPSGDNSNTIKKRFRNREAELEILCERITGGLIRLRHLWPTYKEI